MADLILDLDWLVLVYEILNSAKVNLVHFSKMLELSYFVPNLEIFFGMRSNFEFAFVQILSLMN